MGTLTSERIIEQEWLKQHWGDLARATRDHLLWALLAFVLGCVVGFVLIVIGRRWHLIDRPLRVLALVASAVPAVGIIAGLMPSVTSRPLLIGSVAASVCALLYRSTMHGLDRVDPDIVEEASALGFSRWQRLTRVEFPLARLALRSGVRCAAVAAVGLVAVGGQVLRGGLGRTVREAWVVGPRTQRVSGLVLLGVLCLVVDLAVRLTIRLPRGGSPFESPGVDD